MVAALAVAHCDAVVKGDIGTAHGILYHFPGGNLLLHFLLVNLLLLLPFFEDVVGKKPVQYIGSQGQYEPFDHV